MNILVVEDEHKVAGALKEGLEGESFQVTVASTGEDAFFQLNTIRFDVILLDWLLPGRDGIQLLTTIRKRGLETPVILLTARDTLDDRVHGLNSGADDYLVKPFAFAELVARIRSLLRRGHTKDLLHLRFDDLDMDLVSRKVIRGSRKLELTAREYTLLEYLLRHQNQVVTRDTLARDVWKETTRGTPLNNVIDVHIARIRAKVDAEQRVKIIHTVRGVGFTIRIDET